MCCTDQVSGVSRLLEVLRQQSDGGVEAVRLEPLYGSSLHAQPPGVEAGQQGSPAGGTLGAHVGLAQLHSSLDQALSHSQWSVLLLLEIYQGSHWSSSYITALLLIDF